MNLSVSVNILYGSSTVIVDKSEKTRMSLIFELLYTSALKINLVWEINLFP